jgi:hypothetical protein
MPTSFGRVTVLGEQAIHPSIPRVNVDGNLFARTDGVEFVSDHPQVHPFDIPYPHIEDVLWGQEEPQGAEGLLWTLLIPITVITFGVVSGVMTYVYIQFRDEATHISTSVKFKVGGAYDTTRASSIARQILAEMGNYQGSLRDMVTPQRLK